MGGQLNGFEMRLNPSASRGGAWLEFEERVRIYSREKLESTRCTNNHVSLVHMQFELFEFSTRAQGCVDDA